MTTAFVLSGGGSLGAVQVGMLRALADQQVTPDLLVGTSAGALNAAFVAGHGFETAGIDALARVWGGLRARSVFSLDVRHALGALAGRRSALLVDRGMRALLRQHLRFARLEDSPVPLVVVATDQLTGREMALTEGDAQLAVLASCAIPAVFPAVTLDGVALVDGGLANNTALSAAVSAGADTIYVLPSGYPCALPQAPRTPLSAALHALTLLSHQRLAADLAFYADTVDLIVLPPPCPIRTSAANFARGAELIQRAHRDASTALADAGGRRAQPGHLIAVHSHPASTHGPIDGRGRRTSRLPVVGSCDREISAEPAEPGHCRPCS
ncbi:patatin-like phospholipase family protein [Nocardioides koreensis]|uniref:Patatin-like phospholipase family protein n=1 Tax=Nocardioides koreensis TaxID=433651 RepID=A0ABP5LG42_9ACTN